MKLRGLLISVVVLCALTGALYWAKSHKPANKDLALTKQPVILNVDASSVTGLTLTRQGMPPVVLTKNAGHWRITQPEPLPANADAVTDLLSTLAPLNAERVIETTPGNLGSYGLATPGLQISVRGSDGKTQTLDLGDATPTGNSIYAMVAGKPDVYTTAAYNKSGLDKGLNDLRDTRLVPVDVDKITRMEFRKGGQDIVFGHSKDSWQIEKPKPLRADGEAVDDLAQQVSQARMDLSGPSSSGPAADQSFSRAKPFVTIKVTDNKGVQTLEVRKAATGNSYYAKSSAVQGAYSIDPTVGTALDKNLIDFRNKALFDFSYHQPEKLEMSAQPQPGLKGGPRSWMLSYSGHQWWLDGKRMDSDSVAPLVSELRDLTATKFVTTGFSQPVITVSVTYKTSAGDTKTGQVQISRSGKNDYVAKRGNEPTLYALNPSDVEGLLSAAEGIQPAKGKK